MGSARRDRGYLKSQTRDERRALIAACVQKGESCHPHTTPTSTHRCSMRRTIHKTHTLCALEGRDVSGKGREWEGKREGAGGVREEGRGMLVGKDVSGKGHEGSGKRGGA